MLGLDKKAPAALPPVVLSHTPPKADPVPAVGPPLLTVEELGMLEAPKHGVFALASAEEIDGRWITPDRAAGGSGFYVDVTGSKAAELVHPYAQHVTTTLPDGTIRIRVPNQQLTKLIEDGIYKRAAREGWDDARVVWAPVGASSLDCRDVVRVKQVARCAGIDLAAVAFAAKRARVQGVRDSEGNICEIRIFPIR